MTAAETPSVLTRRAWVVAAVLFVSYAYFYQAGGWNQNTRFALVRAMLEGHTLRIDAYKDQTGDRALWQGHYYSDKAPGTSFLALVPVEAARRVAGALRLDPASRAGVAWTSYVATVATSGLFTLLAAMAVYWLSRRWGATEAGALFAMTAYGLAGPAWCYATVFVGHAVTAGCLMVAFAASVALGERNGRAGAAAWMAGVFCGLAVLSEFPAAVPVVFITGLSWVQVRRQQSGSALLLRVVAAGAILGAILVAYNVAAFGSPFHFGYGSEDNVEGAAMQQGLFGIGAPSLHVVYEVLLGRYRGLLPLAPLMALTPIGLFRLVDDRSRRLAVVVAAGIAGAYVLLNVSYTFWEGGWFYAPRHLTPGLPFLALGLAPLWDRSGRLARSLLVLGWLWGAGMTVVAVSTTPQPPSNVEAPVADLLWPAFREGDLSINNQGFTDFRADPDHLRHNPDAHASWNLGEVVGLHGHASLAPLGVVWVLGALLCL